MSASLLRIFKVAVSCLPSEKITVQVNVSPGFNLLVGGAIDALIFS